MMSDSEEISTFLSKKDFFIPQLSIACVVFGFHENQLHILLLKTKGVQNWLLPVGFVEQEEDIDDAARNILYNRTGVSDIYLEQFRVFGKAKRPTKQSIEDFLTANHSVGIEADWLLKRFVSIGYYALVDFSKVHAKVNEVTLACEWFEVDKLPVLAFDHQEMIEKALETLRFNLDSKVVGTSLLPDVFTMNELQKLYEGVLGESLRRNNFQRKMLSLDILERIEKRYTGAANKAPYLYRFKKN
ncbi:NrtR DNA-binding winged helix domain-containing protein [Runella sp. MFBS21]|uniref:NUDIX hydrolase n=1 Tax=Runella sp. MFBS21 TaxID=3034018 RepID=UPI00286E95D0|nr:NUDIX domain-containing protein [Runella sp. MFBS21]